MDFDAINSATTSRVGSTTAPTTVNGVKVVSTDPTWLAAQAGVDLDVYALARMVASEDYSATPQVMLALAETARNKASSRGQTVSALLLHASTAGSNGLFGEQAAGRWASTRLDPNGRHMEASRQALEDGTDFAEGATDFFDPATQNSGVQGDHALRQNADTYIRARDKEGLHWVGPLDGVNPMRQMFFSRQSGYSLDDGLSAATGSFDASDTAESPVFSDAESPDFPEVDAVEDSGDVGGGGVLVAVGLLVALAIVGVRFG